MSTVSSSNSGIKRKYKFKAVDESFYDSKYSELSFSNYSNNTCEDLASIIVDDSESDINFETWNYLEEDSKVVSSRNDSHYYYDRRSESGIHNQWFKSIKFNFE